MAEESDGIEEAFEGQMRVLVTAAGRVGESFARGREEAKRRALERSQREARELESRLEAERRAAHAEFGNVYRNEWWDMATPRDIGNTYQNARAWANEDPEAVRAEARMRDELRSRYGIDVDNTRADPAAVREAVERAEQNRGQSDVERQRAAAEEAEAARLITEADRADNAAANARAQERDSAAPEAEAPAPATTTITLTDEELAYVREGLSRAAAEREHDASPDAWDDDEKPDYAHMEHRGREAGEVHCLRDRLAREQASQADERAAGAVHAAQRMYDSADRRQATAADLETKGLSSEAVSARMRADVSQAKPATEATKGAIGKSPMARKSRGRTSQAQRSEPSR